MSNCFISAQQHCFKFSSRDSEDDSQHSQSACLSPDVPNDSHGFLDPDVNDYHGHHAQRQEESASNSPSATENSLAELFGDVISERVVVSRGDILLMVLKYACRNNLTFTGLSSLIKLINRVFQSPILPESRYSVNQMITKAGGGITFHFYCTSCYHYADELPDNVSLFECSQCKQTCIVSSVVDAPFFVTFDIRHQLQRVLDDGDFRDLTLNHQSSETVNDIQDGTMYQEFVAATAAVGHRVSFTLNIDGAPVFKSSATAVWPIQLTVNELPPHKRMDKRLLAALWFGREKPKMDIFQTAFVNIMNDISENGFQLQFQGHSVTFKAFCICCAVDSVARAPMQGICQFNGYFGCSWCLHTGKFLAGSMRYPVEEEDSPERTEEQMVMDMQAASESGTTIRGVKAVSPLIGLAQFNIVWSFVPDFMHCMLLGVARQFLEYWLEGAKSRHYIGRYLPELDKKLLGVAPPQEVGRLPRSLKERRFWKASELQNWIMYYSIPVLEGILCIPYLSHWALLVESLHAMMQGSIHQRELDTAEHLLLTFVCKTQDLYGEAAMTYNIHQLLHIVKSVRLWGPLWAHSSYPFECGNGKIKASIKAANGIPHQVCRMLAIEALTEKLVQVTDNERAVIYCSELDEQLTKKTAAVPSDRVRFFGRPSVFTPISHQQENSFSAGAAEYKRMVVAKTVYTTSTYASSKRTNNSVVKLCDGSYAVIKQLIHDNHLGFAVVTRLRCKPSKYCSMQKPFMVEVIGEEVSPIIVRTVNILSPCVFSAMDKTYVMTVPKALLF